MPGERLARQVLLATLTGKRSRGRPRTRWSDYISDLAWSRLGIKPEELSEIAIDCEVSRDLGLLPLATLPRGKVGRKMNKKCIFEAQYMVMRRSSHPPH